MITPPAFRSAERRVLLPVFLALALAACSDAGPTSPPAEALFSCLYGEAGSPELGEVAQGGGAAATSLCLGGGPEGAEYLLVPFFGTGPGSSRLSVRVAGGGTTSDVEDVEPPAAASRSLRGADLPRFLPAPGTAERDARSDFHRRVREREIRELTPLIAPAREAAAGRADRAAFDPGRVEAPATGDLLELNAAAACEETDPRTGRVEAVGEGAIVVADTSNPAGGFEDDDWQAIAAAYDTLVIPVTRENFGAPTDLDGNDRVILFYTRAVNELSPPGGGVMVGGFFFAGDLFPDEMEGNLPGCPGSNFGEIVYLLVPDPSSETGNAIARETVRRITLGTVGHEVQHLVNASRRVYVNGAEQFEDVWLNEGLSHVAEELLFHRVTPLEPGDNVDLEDLLASQEILDAFNRYAVGNLANYAFFLEEPDRETPLGMPTAAGRGASWALLRYLIDRGETPQASLLFDLVNTTEAGLENLSSALGTDAVDRIRDWSVAVFTDDAVPAAPSRFMQPSWNYRSIVPAFEFTGDFPLPERRLSSGEPEDFELRPGGAAFLRFRIEPGERATLELTAGGEPPPPTLRFSLVRTR